MGHAHRRLRTATGALGMMLLAACGQDADVGNPATSEPETGELGSAECDGPAEAWDIGFAEDADGEASPEEALERAESTAPSPMPSGEPVEVARAASHVDYAFVEGERYTGSATVRRLDDTWLVEGAVVCQ